MTSFRPGCRERKGEEKWFKEAAIGGCWLRMMLSIVPSPLPTPEPQGSSSPPASQPYQRHEWVGVVRDSRTDRCPPYGRAANHLYNMTWKQVHFSERVMTVYSHDNLCSLSFLEQVSFGLFFLFPFFFFSFCPLLTFPSELSFAGKSRTTQGSAPWCMSSSNQSFSGQKTTPFLLQVDICQNPGRSTSHNQQQHVPSGLLRSGKGNTA